MHIAPVRSMYCLILIGDFSLVVVVVDFIAIVIVVGIKKWKRGEGRYINDLTGSRHYHTGF